MRTFIGVMFTALLTACAPGDSGPQVAQRDPNTIEDSETAVNLVTNKHFSVDRIFIFNDRTAYHGERGLYVITDKQTGSQYIGISGVGISETGSHGKAQRDER